MTHTISRLLNSMCYFHQAWSDGLHWATVFNDLFNCSCLPCILIHLFLNTMHCTITITVLISSCCHIYTNRYHYGMFFKKCKLDVYRPLRCAFVSLPWKGCILLCTGPALLDELRQSIVCSRFSKLHYLLLRRLYAWLYNSFTCSSIAQLVHCCLWGCGRCRGFVPQIWFWCTMGVI